MTLSWLNQNVTTRRISARRKKLQIHLGRNFKIQKVGSEAVRFTVTFTPDSSPATMGVTQKSIFFLQMKLNQTQGFVFRYVPIGPSNSPDPKFKTDGFRLSSIRQPVWTAPSVEFGVGSYYEVGLKSLPGNLRPTPTANRVRGICLLTLCLLNRLVALSKF